MILKNSIRFICIAFTAFGYGQIKNIETSATHIAENPGAFVTPKDGKYTVNTVIPTYNENTKNLDYNNYPDNKTRNLDEIIASYKTARSEIIPISSLRKISFESAIDELKGITFKYPEQEHKSFYMKMDVLNKDFALLRYYMKDTPSSPLRLFNATILDIYPVTVNKDFLYLYLFRNGHSVGHIIAEKQKFYLKIIENNDVPVVLPRTDHTAMAETLRSYPPEHEIVSRGGKYGVQTKYSQKTVIEPVYDSIVESHSAVPFIIAFSGKKIDVFRLNGENLGLQNIRAIHLDHRLNVLTNDGVYCVDDDGKLSVNKPPYVMECGTYDRTDKTIVVENGNYVVKYKRGYGENRTESTVAIAPKSDFKNVYFLNQTQSSTEGGFSEQPRGFYIVELTNGKKAIIKSDNKKQNSYSFSLEPDDYVFSGYNPIKFEVRNTFGYWPLHNKPEYSALADFDKGFARFKTIDGRHGWLRLDGATYFDE